MFNQRERPSISPRAPSCGVSLLSVFVLHGFLILQVYVVVFLFGSVFLNQLSSEHADDWKSCL